MLRALVNFRHFLGCPSMLIAIDGCSPETLARTLFCFLGTPREFNTGAQQYHSFGLPYSQILESSVFFSRAAWMKSLIHLSRFAPKSL